jgi:hypothetical protein
VCIYSGRPLAKTKWDLDHFVPWSFVAHDQLWNLVPAENSANERKGSRLPHTKQLVQLAAMQAAALVSARPVYTAHNWKRVTESYLTELEVPETVLWVGELDSRVVRQELEHAYTRKVPPLLALAEAHGFMRMAG